MPPAPTTTKTLTTSTNESLIQSPDDFQLDDALSNGKPAATIGSNGITKRRVPESKNGAKSAASEKEVDMHGEGKVDIVWRNIILFTYLHTAALYGGYLWVTGQVMWQTFLWGQNL